MLAVAPLPYRGTTKECGISKPKGAHSRSPSLNHVGRRLSVVHLHLHPAWVTFFSPCPLHVHRVLQALIVIAAVALASFAPAVRQVRSGGRYA